MQPEISFKTVERVQKLTGKPISRGFEKAIIQILDEYERLEKSRSLYLKKEFS